MSSKVVRIGAALLVATLAALAVRATIAIGADGSAADPDDSPGLDVKSAYHKDTASQITLGFQTYEAFENTALGNVQRWLLDLDGSGGFADCVQVVKSAQYQAELYDDCGEQVAATAPVMRPAADKLEFELPISELKLIGLPATATQYKYKFTTKDSSNNVDTVPDTDSITHTLGGSSSTPAPTAAPTSAAPTSGATATPTSTKTPTPAPTSTSSSTASPGATATPAATPTPSPCPSPSASASPTASPAASASASPSATPSSAPTPTPTGTPTPTPTPSATGCVVTVQGTPSTSTAKPGDKVQIAGNGFTKDVSLAVTFQSTPVALGTVVADANGAFATTVTIPASAEPGAHHIVVTGANATGGTRAVRFPITVTSATGVDPGTSGSTTSAGSSSGTDVAGASLPRTGLDIMKVLVVALLFVLFGVNAIDSKPLDRRGRPRA
jgi:hypothetical protein